MAKFLKAGSCVRRLPRTMPKGKGMSYKAEIGFLLEDARVGAGAGWDVVDLRPVATSRTTSAYSFDLVPASCGKKAKKR